MTQRLYLLVALLNAVHVDTVKEKSVVAVRAQASFPANLWCSHHPRGQWNHLNKPDAPDSRRAWGAWIVFLVETGESRTPNADHSVAAALRELSVCLARLADTLDWTDHTSKHNQRTDHW